MEGIRSADGFGLFVFLGIIFFVLNVIAKVGQRTKAAASPPGPGGAQGKVAAPVGQEELSLESILRQIEAVKRQQGQTVTRPAPQGRPALQFQPRPAPPRQREVVQDARGPLGRISQARLQSAEEVEDRTSLGDQGRLEAERRLQNVEVFAARPERAIQNRDAEAESLAQRRIQSAAARNRPHAAVDHASFDRTIRKTEEPALGPPRRSVQALRDAFVWREILGAPKSLQEE